MSYRGLEGEVIIKVTKEQKKLRRIGKGESKEGSMWREVDHSPRCL